MAPGVGVTEMKKLILLVFAPIYIAIGVIADLVRGKR